MTLSDRLKNAYVGFNHFIQINSIQENLPKFLFMRYGAAFFGKSFPGIDWAICAFFPDTKTFEFILVGQDKNDQSYFGFEHIFAKMDPLFFCRKFKMTTRPVGLFFDMAKTTKKVKVVDQNVSVNIVRTVKNRKLKFQVSMNAILPNVESKDYSFKLDNSAGQLMSLKDEKKDNFNVEMKRIYIKGIDPTTLPCLTDEISRLLNSIINMPRSKRSCEDLFALENGGDDWFGKIYP